MSEQLAPDDVEVRWLDLTDDDEWPDTAVRAWLDAAKAAGVEAEEYSNQVPADGRATAWIVAQGRLYLVNVYPMDPRNRMVRADRDGRVCERVTLSDTGIYSSVYGGLEQWDDVIREADESNARVEEAGPLTGWGPFVTAYRVTEPDGEVRYYMVDPA